MIDDKFLPEIEKRVHRRWEFLSNLTNTNAVEGLKYLTLVHLGGMGAVLSYMGATKSTNLALVLAFFSFFVGATSVGLTYYLRAIHYSRLLKGWNSDTKTMFSSEEMTWEMVRLNDAKRTQATDWALRFALLSLVCFTFGGVTAFFGVLNQIR
ncbi:hypothetical protein Undi14_01380 [Undibacterium sp. 14-3-2]|uniref:hypothetical protein n=1 Tax=Undibacterium sp. 14-3-2 TaxID=2800129 RepID=UPI001906735B|nr:hypothetical protein [Undibacterium sp. 14-3-2]MBK1888668.1 hypothetical protein [Undibacterium sp. 14-3-2]